MTTDSLPEFDINSDDAASRMLSEWYNAIFVDMRPMGSGKTLFTALLWAYLQMNNKAFGYVAPRVSIITDIANRLDIEHYNEVSPGELFQSLAACVNSAVGREHLLSFFRQVDCIVLDEFKQIVEHIVRGPFNNRSEGYDLLIDIIKTVPVVYVADADMNDQMIKILESAGKPMFKIKGSEREPTATIKHTTPKIAKSEFLNRVKAGKTGLFQCDSLSTANIAYEDAKATAPADYKILLVHGKNKHEFEQAAYLKSPNEVGKQYDLIILTPVVSSGFSIELEYDFHVCVFSGQLSPTEIIQTLGRNRKAKDIILGLSPKRKQKPLSVTEQIAGIVLAEKRIKITDGQLIHEPNEFDKVAAGIMEEYERSCERFAHTTLLILEQKGYKVEALEEPESLIIIKGTAKTVKAKHVQDVIQADSISDSEHSNLKKSSKVTESDHNAIEKFECREQLALGEEVSEKDIPHSYEFITGKKSTHPVFIEKGDR
ncbi:putative DNA primase/helicase [Bathymodiolus platifrons methanotrophic gill symbiont]|nr:putative DNA primase/helicase [Bathymodiolus platifrons methanotrophic gill symbiont]